MLICFCGYSGQVDGYRRKFAAHFMDLKVWEITLVTQGRHRQNSDPRSGFQVLLKSSSAEGMMRSREKTLMTNISA